MPRRASSGINIGQIAGIAAAIVGFLVIAALVIKLIAGDFISGGNKRSAPRNATPMNLANYRDNANSLRSNVYQIHGKIAELLRWSPKGRLISFDATDGSLTIPVPVLVPAEFQNVNLERGSELEMVVRVDPDGMLVAESIEN